eukprot:1143063-Pelagomonas_calceolata.AAC.5
MQPTRLMRSLHSQCPLQFRSEIARETMGTYRSSRLGRHDGFLRLWPLVYLLESLSTMYSYPSSLEDRRDSFQTIWPLALLESHANHINLPVSL